MRLVSSRQVPSADGQSLTLPLSRKGFMTRSSAACSPSVFSSAEVPTSSFGFDEGEDADWQFAEDRPVDDVQFGGSKEGRPLPAREVEAAARIEHGLPGIFRQLRSLHAELDRQFGLALERVPKRPSKKLVDVEVRLKHRLEEIGADLLQQLLVSAVEEMGSTGTAAAHRDRAADADT